MHEAETNAWDLAVESRGVWLRRQNKTSVKRHVELSGLGVDIKTLPEPSCCSSLIHF